MISAIEQAIQPQPGGTRQAAISLGERQQSAFFDTLQQTSASYEAPSRAPERERAAPPAAHRDETPPPAQHHQRPKRLTEDAQQPTSQAKRYAQPRPSHGGSQTTASADRPSQVGEGEPIHQASQGRAAQSEGDDQGPEDPAAQAIAAVFGLQGQAQPMRATPAEGELAAEFSLAAREQSLRATPAEGALAAEFSLAAREQSLRATPAEGELAAEFSLAAREQSLRATPAEGELAAELAANPTQATGNVLVGGNEDAEDAFQPGLLGAHLTKDNPSLTAASLGTEEVQSTRNANPNRVVDLKTNASTNAFDQTFLNEEGALPGNNGQTGKLNALNQQIQTAQSQLTAQTEGRAARGQPTNLSLKEQLGIVKEPQAKPTLEASQAASQADLAKSEGLKNLNALGNQTKTHQPSSAATYAASTLGSSAAPGLAAQEAGGQSDFLMQQDQKNQMASQLPVNQRGEAASNTQNTMRFDAALGQATASTAATQTHAAAGTQGTGEINPRGLLDQVAGEARLMMSNARKEATMQLTPEHLGKLDLKIVSTRAGALSIEMTVENSTVKSLLESQQQELRTRLAANQDVEQFDLQVNVRQENNGGKEFGRQHAQDNAQGRSNADKTSADASSNARNAQTADSNPAYAGGVDANGVSIFA